jgi:hypothetical protein
MYIAQNLSKVEVTHNQDCPAASEDTVRTARVIGRGRSGVVYLNGTRSRGEHATVRKVFGGDLANRIVLYVLTGAPNPYAWCESAVLAAACRRRILARLVKFWFGDTLRLPDTSGTAWNYVHAAFELRSEFIRGHHAPLRQPTWQPGDEELVDSLVRDVMKPLQARLMQCGFDGLVWQAGLGNPVAANNFMLDDGAGAAPRWVWIDLESGVPALFPMNPLALLRIYLPLCLRYRRWLFDDANIDRLRRYVQDHETALAAHCAPFELQRLHTDIDDLEREQKQWKSIPRHCRSIGYDLSKGRISVQEADWFRDRPLRWYAKLALRWLQKVPVSLARLVNNAWTWLKMRRWRRLAQSAWLFIASQRFRAFWARYYVTGRVHSWRQRGFFDAATARALRSELRQDEASAYLTDFGVHLAIKPFVKTIQLWVIPALFALGVIESGMVAGAIFVAGGAIGRTAYTTGRMIQSALHRERLPWLALALGILPVVGNAAYPAQLVYHGAHNGRGIARFILRDTFARIGQHFPIFGGNDTLTEHWFNRLPDVLFRSRLLFRLRTESTQ